MRHKYTNPLRWLFLLVLVVLLAAGYLFYRWLYPGLKRSANVLTWLREPDAHPEWEVAAGERCGDAPFLLPTSGYIGYLWKDAFKLGRLHQGIDIFGGGGVNQTPIVAAYAGYLTRLKDWKSSVIIRIPDDPLLPGRIIWTYYTHMADAGGNSLVAEAFPAGTVETYVEAGTLLGYQGNYSGDPGNPVGVHLHFSIVLDDGRGKFRNELEVRNTLDPSAYLGLPLNAETSAGLVTLQDCHQVVEP